MIKTRSSLFKVLGVTLFFLLIPLVASIISDQIDWHVNDYILMGFMVFTTGLIVINVLKVIKKKNSLDNHSPPVLYIFICLG